MTDEFEVLRRAADAARAQPEPGWTDVSGAIQERLRTVVRRSRMIRAQAPGGPILIADTVLVTYLREAVDAIPGGRLARVVLHGDGDECTGVLVEVVAGYGTDLQDLASQVRSTTYAVLGDLLGPVVPGLDTDGVDVTVIDIG